MNGGREHPLPAPPPPNKADDAIPELVNLLGSFDWATDVVDRCAKTILNENSTITELASAVQELKQLLCTSRDNVFGIAQEVLDSGVLLGLVRLAGDCHTQQQQQNQSGVQSSVAIELRLRAAFCLTNIAAGSDAQTAEVVKAGGVPVMLELLRHPDEGLRRQAIFCLANIAGATPECRVMLAENPAYVSSLKYAMDNSSDYRMEELVGWNLRNMVVLGGPALEQCGEALDILTEKLVTSAPKYHLCYTLMMNGVATYTSLECNVVNWFKFGPGGNSESGCSLGGFAGSMGNRVILRFVGEVLSFVSRQRKGRQYIFDNELLVPVLYLAKFSPTPSVRNYMTEILVNLTSQVEDKSLYFFALGGVHGLGELLADGFSYSPHQRVLVAKCLWKLAEAANSRELSVMTQANIISRPSVIEAKSDVIRSAINVIREHPDQRESDLDMEHFHLETMDREDALYIDSPDIPRDRTRDSLLSIAYTIYTEYYGPEEASLREKCGRLFVAILLKVEPHILRRYGSVEFLSFLIHMAEFAAQVDAMSVNLDTADVLEEAAATPAASGSVADVMDALKVGEYLANPESMFLFNVLALLQKILAEGENMRREAHAIDNPICAMIKHGNEVSRLETCLAQGALPLELVNDAYKMIEKYAY